MFEKVLVPSGSKSENDKKSRKILEKSLFYSQFRQPCHTFSARSLKIFRLKSKSFKKIWKLSEKLLQTVPPDKKVAVLQSMQNFWWPNCKQFYLKGRKWWKNKLLEKKSFSSKLSSRHIKCSFDKLTELFPLKVWKFFAQSLKMILKVD